MFIGDKIYSESRENSDPVCVRAIQYKVDDAVFNETEVDFRGNTKYSSMIVKLCDYNRRSDFIVGVIGDLIKEEAENTLAKSVLLSQFLHKCIVKSLFVYILFLSPSLYDAIMPHFLHTCTLSVALAATLSSTLSVADAATLSSTLS